MNITRKRKKELKKLQQSANQLWASQQVLLGDAANVAREAGRQLGKYGREQVVPTVQHEYEERVAPYVNRGVNASKSFLDKRVVPVVGGVVGTAISAWDAAKTTRERVAHGGPVFTLASAPAPAPKKGTSAGSVIAIILGVGAAIGVLYAAWQTLRADDELWVADDPLAAPEA
ncbi:hypothetical protein GCM10009860_14720 [Microbacterium mitrae]|uniref:DNA helicase n=1 Tax=Microbacterium mitrae TaxID=664640 RepID=A0A5C8HNA6_9MICO|nr:DNA helicase [Microbacterium mitrae]TXK03438.1 DNA helicase [Microbacterium mitrae]